MTIKTHNKLQLIDKVNCMSKPLYIVAGNHKQAQRLARDLQLAPNQWVYLHRKDQLRGIRNFMYTTFGSAWENPVTRMGEDLRLADAIFVKHSELQQIVQAGIQLELNGNLK